MNDLMRREAVEAARQLLQRFKGEHPDWVDDKTPVDELVSWFGLEVVTFHPDDQPQGTYGWLEPGEDLIWLCRGLPETLRRFTLAHELGHAVLHRQAGQAVASLSGAPWSASRGFEGELLAEPSHDDPCQVVDVQEEVTSLLDQEQIEEILGIGQSYNPRSQRELAANIFAAELLMPLERLQTLYLSSQTPPARLAGIFGVSAAAILNRLVGLLHDPLVTGVINRATTANKEHDEFQHGADTSVGAINRSTTPFDVGTIVQADKPASEINQTGAINRASTVKKEYDEFQQAAIEAPTPALIVAGPGCGETSTLIGRAEYVIRTLGVAPEHILALTFSRKAAQEMQERLNGP